MNDKLKCKIISDLLPLYMDGLTSKETNTFIKSHLEECSDCQNDYQAFQTELTNSANKNKNAKIQEIDYLKKINKYQRMNFVLGAIISFLFGVCIPVLRVGISCLLIGAIPDYYLARFQIAWHFALFKMAVSGIIVCLIYMIIMFIIRKKISGKTSWVNQRSR